MGPEAIMALDVVAKNAGALKELVDMLPGALPNIPVATLGGKVFWITLATCDSGWRLQRNMFTQHCRILNEKNVRMAWGREKAMFDILDRIYENRGKYC